ncbi:hypothetical protein [Streptomyces sp. NPDC127038]|uniref:hypothetical protein n=1 Tax=Streptomyces sp. NPDC127038 TaxID=3347114 RepID=UPI0036497378
MREKVFLSDAEIHRESDFATAEDLRARVLFHVLFSDELLIGDSQCLNTPLFRALVSPAEARRHGVRGDLGQLLDNGRIQVARRDGLTLREVHASQALREVKHRPDAGYADELDRRIRAHPVSYDFGAVAAAFKSGVLRLIGRRLSGTEGATYDVLERAREWVTGQEPLYFNSVKNWVEGFRTADGSVPAALVLALEAVDRAAGEAYRQALPTVLGASTAASEGLEGLTDAATRRTVVERTGFAAGVLDPFLLGRIPVDVLLEATEQPSRTALVEELAVMKNGERPDLDRFQEAMAEFSGWTREAFGRAFDATDERELAVLRGRRNLMRYGITEDSLTGTLGAVLDVGPVDDSRNEYLDARFAARSVPVPAAPAAPPAHPPVRQRRRAVIGSAGR